MPVSNRFRLLLSLLMMTLAVGPAMTWGDQPSLSNEGKPLQIEGRVPQAGMVTLSSEQIPKDVLGVEMLKPLLGVVGVLEPRDMVAINRHARPLGVGDTPASSDPIAYIHYERGQSTGTLRVSSIGEGKLLLSSLDKAPLRWILDREVADRLGIGFEAMPSPDRFAASPDSLTLVLPPPHVESKIVLDPQTIRARIRLSYPRLERELGKETFRVRLPKNYDPNASAGVLVWISPSPDGRIPEIFAPVCDELGLIALGVDNNGNQREITDRLQNHLDSIETLAQHAHIDRDRVYVTGASGGGRSSSILQLSFPEHFAGCVPIIGLDTYHNAPTGDPGKYWPKRLGKPSGPNMVLLKSRRIRSITGTADFNEPEMTLRTRLLRDDGLEAEIDVIEGMAHALPSAEQFAGALRWVDEPRREAIEDARALAQSILDQVRIQDPSTPAVRRRVIEVMQLVPNSDLAWEAAGMLGYKHP